MTNKYIVYKPTGKYDVVTADCVIADEEGVSFYISKEPPEILIAFYKDWTHFFVDGYVKEGTDDR